MSAPGWVTEFAELCAEGARRHEREARSLRKLRRDVLDPPPGTEVMYGGRNCVLLTTKGVSPSGKERGE